MSDSSVSTNTPPDVRKHFARLDALMKSNQDFETEPDSEEYEEYEEQEDDVEIADVEVSLAKPKEPHSITKTETPKRLYRITMTHEVYKVSFMIQDISVADYQIAIRIPKTDFKFEPHPNSRFKLACMDKEYPVIYLGGLFDFPSDDSWNITFMLDNDSWSPNAQS